MNADYEALVAQAQALCEDVDDITASLANISSLIYTSLEEISWAGFYLIKRGRLVLGPFQGKPACVYIPLCGGVCGSAAQRDETLAVDDVHAFPGHIACDCESNSELVVPLHARGRVCGVMDLDSRALSRFKEADKAGFEGLGAFIDALLDRLY